MPIILLLCFIQNLYADHLEYDETRYSYRAVYTKPPANSRQLGPAIFLPKKIIGRIGISEGDPIYVALGTKRMQLRVYSKLTSSTVFGLHKYLARKLGVKKGKNTLIFSYVPPDLITLPPKPVGLSIKQYKGIPTLWPRIVFSAPHGDGDWETGAILEVLASEFKIPSVAYYGCRLTYRGFWYDCNRPLMKLPKPVTGVYKTRVWNQDAISVYEKYQNSLWQTARIEKDKRFKFFVSFHGHDLTYKGQNGSTLPRPVIEGVGVGFSKTQLKKIKAFYKANGTKYFKNPPALYFGNLGSDQTYTIKGVSVPFYYSALGTRTYGTLRSDLVEYALHLETPNSIRLGEGAKLQTASFLKDLTNYIVDELLAENERTITIRRQLARNRVLDKKVYIAKNKFPMGAKEGAGWDSEHPRHQSTAGPILMSLYEVTNKQYVKFLNSAHIAGVIVVIDGVVFDANDLSHTLFKTKKAAKFGQIAFVGDKFVVDEGKEDFPVVYVSYYGAKFYANFCGERLPLETEWEMAASWDPVANKKYRYGTSSDELQMSWANTENSGDSYEVKPSALQTTPVGLYSRTSPSGLYDMSGNVWEWCDDYFKSSYGSSTANETMRVIRGGAWNTEAIMTRTTLKLGINPNSTLINVGFRTVLDP
ncbi:MAG: SUMF1/EgtB/PvdO family nonheme iron enzyme [Bacteriovoracaceae bacterium]|nr:SUMF1/EgtB/PvdO family nonheme iron enzyme [Bacteriovoracaceae bacterium]